MSGTVEAVGAHIVRLVLADIASDPDRFGAVRSWGDLHDVTDANVYAEEAGRIVGILAYAVTVPEESAIYNAAEDYAIAVLWPVSA